MVKIALQEENIPFEEVELSSNLDLLRRIKAETGRSTVPQVFVGGELVGGADETLAMMKEGDFQMKVLKAGSSPPLPPELMEALRQGQEKQQVCHALNASLQVPDTPSGGNSMIHDGCMGAGLLVRKVGVFEGPLKGLGMCSKRSNKRCKEPVTILF